MSAYRYYKLNFTAGRDLYVFMVCEIELYSWIPPAPGADLTTPSMTVTDSQNYGAGYEGLKAFNNTFGTGPGYRWQCNSTSYPIWVKIDLGAGNAQEVVSHMVMADDSNYSPKDWTLQGSNDDSSWTTLVTVTNQTGWWTGEQRVFSTGTPYTLSGTVKDVAGNGIGRTVRVVRKTDGAYLGDVTSNSSTGVWSIAAPVSGPYQVIAFKPSANDEEALIYDGVTAV